MTLEVKDKNGLTIRLACLPLRNKRERKPVLDYYPKVIQLPITEVCNLECVFCGSRQQDYFTQQKSKRTEIEVWILDKLGNDLFRETQLYLTGGGEPLLSNIFWEFIDEKRPSGGIFFNTNGILLDQNNINRILSYSGQLDLGISLNACKPHIYKRLMGIDCFDKVLLNAKNLMDRAQALKKKIKLSLTMVVVKENLDEMLLFPEIAKEIGAGCVTIQMAGFEYVYSRDWFCVQEQKISNNKQLLEQFESYITEIEKLCRELRIGFWSRDGSDNEWRHMCDEIFDFLGIWPNGQTFSCCKGCLVPTGNLKDYNNFWELWNNEKRQKMRQCLLQGGFPEECRKPGCPYWRTKKKYSESSFPEKFCQSVFASEIVKIDPIPCFEAANGFKLRARIKNAGSNDWPPTSESGIKFGCRIFKQADEIEYPAIREFREVLVKVTPPEGIIEAEIFINLQDIIPGEYILLADMVKEDCFWFQDKGSLPSKFALKVG